MTTRNIVSVSGGKDSTATLLVALALGVPNLQAVFADTGHEHPETYGYVRYLAEATGVPIRWVRADFSAQIARKREFIVARWPQALMDGVPGEWEWHGVTDGECEQPYNPLTREAIEYPERPADPYRTHVVLRGSGRFVWNPGRRPLSSAEAEGVIRAALDVLQPTGIPFLDLCLWKGRFPSAKHRFCTEELKRNPIIEQVFLPLMDGKSMLLSWQGVRRDESLARRYLPECDEVGGGLFNYRPILRWPVEAVFEAHRAAGIQPNPLYLQGCGRVGCMPCVNCAKDELREIADRWPEEVARVREWERLVSLASRRGAATFFAAVTDPTVHSLDHINAVTHGIDRIVDWSRTSKGGRQFDLLAAVSDTNACSSAYGLCEHG